MATAQDIIDKAAEKANIVGEGQSLTNDQSTTGLGLLNDYIASLKNDGCDLQLDTLSSGDTVYVDDSELMMLKYNLSVLFSEHYSLNPSRLVFARAEELEDRVRGKYFEAGLEEMELPAMFSGGRAYDINTGR